MIAAQVVRGRTVKTVTVAEIHPSEDDAAVLAVALVAARETRSSLFGWRVEREGSRARVELHTD